MFSWYWLTGLVLVKGLKCVVDVCIKKYCNSQSAIAQQLK